MHRFRRKLARSALPLFALLLISLNARSTTVVMLSDSDLIVNSRLIVTGTIQSVTCARDASSMVWTYVELKPDRVIKGTVPADTLVLKQPGGSVGDFGVHVFGQPGFAAGQEVLLYLNTAVDGTLHVAHSFVGAFSVVQDKETGKRFVERPPMGDEVEILSRTDGAAITNRALFHSYLRLVGDTLDREAARVAEIGAQQNATPLVVIPPEYIKGETQQPGYSPSFALLGGGVRWMQADSGQPINYYLNSDRSPIAGGGVAEITRAMQAWPSQSGAKIQLQNAGSTSSCGAAVDNVNTISFGDCLNQLDPPVACSGVVAQTQVAWNGQTQVVGGRSFNRLIEADVVFNKGMDCFLGVSANLAEAACHELGHSIGLDHPTDPAAIMWGQLHGHGRDATLGNDDKAGVLTIYPAAPGGGGGGGGGGSAPVTVTSVNLADGVVGQPYQKGLSATGGTPPYRWSLVGGAEPPGLRMTSDGLLQGTPTQAGNYSLLVLARDALGTASPDKQVSIRIVSGQGTSIAPLVTRVRIKNSKKLWVFGQNFRLDSLILLNGVYLTPGSFEQDGETGTLFFKGRLSLAPDGSNVLFVLNSDGRSSPFVF